MNLGEGRRSAWAMDSRISRLQSFRENRENMIEYTEELIQVRDHRPISGFPENVSAKNRGNQESDLPYKPLKQTTKVSFMFYSTPLTGDGICMDIDLGLRRINHQGCASNISAYQNLEFAKLEKYFFLFF